MMSDLLAADRQAFATLRAAALEDEPAILGAHPDQKSMRPLTMARVGLECALGHEKSLLLMNWVSFEANEKYK